MYLCKTDDSMDRVHVDVTEDVGESRNVKRRKDGKST